MSPFELSLLLRTIFVRGGRLVDVDKIVDQPSSADRCLLVAQLLAQMATDPVVAQVIRDTQLLSIIKDELFKRKRENETN